MFFFAELKLAKVGMVKIAFDNDAKNCNSEVCELASIN